MLDFQLVRTARFSFQLQELSLADTRALLNISPQFSEKMRTEFLNRALTTLEWHRGYEQCQLADLTVQERLFIEASYLSQVADEANFALGDGRYTDYLQVDKQFKQAEIQLGAIPGDDDQWRIKPLTGLAIEAIEERVLALDNPERIDWICFAMSAQLYRENEQCPDEQADFIAYGDWLEARAARMSALPESAFFALISLYFEGLEKLTHFFAINFDDDGIVLMPAKPKDEQADEQSSEQSSKQPNKQDAQAVEKGGKVATLPARFHPFAKIAPTTKAILGKSDDVKS